MVLFYLARGFYRLKCWLNQVWLFLKNELDEFQIKGTAASTAAINAILPVRAVPYNLCEEGILNPSTRLADLGVAEAA
jgi:hypothetical protein